MAVLGMEKKNKPTETTDIERRLARLSAFEEIWRAIGASLELDEICRRALDAAMRVINGKLGAIYAADWDKRQLNAIIFTGASDEFQSQFRLLPLDTSSISGRAALTGKPQLGTSGRLPPISRKVAAAVGSRNILAVPISSKGKVIGALSVYADPKQKLTPEDVDLLANVAAPIGVAMSNAQMYAECQDINTRLIDTSIRLRSLLNAAEDINSRLEVGTVLRRIVELAAHITAATEGVVALREDQGIVMREWWDGQHWQPYEFAWKNKEGGPGWVLATGKPYMTNDAPRDPHTVPEMVKMMKLRNFIITPMLSREGEVLGVFEIDNKAGDQPFTEDDLEMATAFSRLTAVALQNAQLFHDVDSTKNLLQTMIDNAVAYINYLDTNFTIRRVSRKSAAFFGLQPEDLLGRNVFEVLPWLKEHSAAESILRAVRTGKRQELMETRLTLPDRPDTYWDLVAVPFKDPAGRVEGVLNIATDVTVKIAERREAEERARREKAINDVALAVNSGAGLHDVLCIAIDRMTEAIGAAGGAILLLDGSGRKLRAVIATAQLGIAVEGMEFDLSEAWMAKQARRRKKPVFLRREDATGKAQKYLAEIADSGVLGIPLFAAGEFTGMVYLTYREPRQEPAEAELNFVASLAGQCAIAIDNARLLEEARTQRARLESVIMQMPEGIAIADKLAGRLVLLNRRAREIAGTSFKAGMPISDIPEKLGLYHPDGRPFQKEELALYRALFLGETVRGEEVIIRKAGRKERAALAGAVPLVDERGQVHEAVLVFQDTTPLKEAQKRAEEAAQVAQRQKAEGDAIIQTLAEGVVITDPAGNVLRANSAAATIMGFRTFEETYPRIEDYRFLDIRDANGQPLSTEQWPIARAMRGESFSEQEVIVTGADGRVRHLLVGGSCVCGPRKKVIMAIIVFRDISTIRDFERQREEFISVVAHDLRSALTVARGHTQILLRTAVGAALPEKAKRPLEAIDNSTKRLERMISDLLDVSRIEARRLKLERRTVDLPALVKTVVERSAELTKGHQVRLEVREPAMTVVADADRIEQVLTNLLSNAGKYSYPQSPITVEVELREVEAMVSVTNLGPGISREDIPRLFTRFHRTEAAAKEKVPGLGLGLYISKGLVEAHGGRIWVESEPEKHATFRFTIPLSRPSGRRRKSTRERLPGG